MAIEKPASSNDEAEFDALASPADRLFESIAQAPIDRSDFSRRQVWYFYINGYKDAADFLVDHALVEADARKLGYPILFLYRQHLELALKALIRDCRLFVGWDEAFPKTHRVDELWRICCGLLKDISPGMANNNDVLHTTRLIGDLCRVDPNSEAFRYPEDKNGNLPVLDTEVVLPNVKEAVGKISLIIECISTDLSVRKDAL